MQSQMDWLITMASYFTMYPTLWTLVYLIGLLKVLHFLYRLTTYCYLSFNKSTLQQRYGHGWAIVTGATDGIGLAFCRSLAQKGVNVVLISRNQEKLKKVEAELKSINNKIQTKIVVADFEHSLRQKQMFDRIYEAVEKLDVVMLVNNVGILNVGKFDEIPEKQLVNEITVNQVPMVYLLKRILPLLKLHITQTSRRAAIVNISSFSAVDPIPFQATYCATKSFGDFFTRALTAQFKGSGIDFLNVQPGIVNSNMTRDFDTEMKILGISVEACVNGAWRDLGVLEVGAPSLFHKVQLWTNSLPPSFVSQRIKGGMMKRNLQHLLKSRK